MDRLFLDANILVSAAQQPNALLAQFWKLKDVMLCSSQYALQEARLNLRDETQKLRLARLAQKLQLFDAHPRELPREAVLPPKDAPILLAAIEARATHLITGDLQHFGPYFRKTIGGILVLTPSRYLKMHRSK